MPPTTRGAHRRFARQLREAHLRATPTETTDLDRLERLVRSEALDVFAAQRVLTEVLRAQRARTDQSQAA
jgi:hypothetical protein